MGHEVFAEKGFQPGQGPLVPGADRLLPGELYNSKWGTPGGVSVLRNMAGTSEVFETANEPIASKTSEKPDPNRSRENGDSAAVK